MPYRVILPQSLPAGKKCSVIYLLHGGGGNYHDWSNYSDVAKLAESGYILVMPEGHSSYYTNAAARPEDRYEDYIAKDLLADVEMKFPVFPDRSHRAIIGVSMGGFGAIRIALDHWDLFAFAGALSPALDAPTRPFSIKRVEQWRRFRAIFGPIHSEAQHANDPFVLAVSRSMQNHPYPYLFLACGEQEGLLSVNQRFASLLAKCHYQFEFHTTTGNHDWNQWNSWLPTLSDSLAKHWE